MPRPARQWTELERGKFLAALAAGMTPKQAAQEAEVPLMSAVQLKIRDEAFREAWLEAWDEGADVLEAEAQRRAVDGTLKPIVSAGRVVETVREYSDTLLIFLLKSRRPERFARFEGQGSHAKPLVVELKQSPEQLAAVAQVLAGAGVLPKPDLKVVEGGNGS